MKLLRRVIGILHSLCPHDSVKTELFCGDAAPWGVWRCNDCGAIRVNRALEGTLPWDYKYPTEQFHGPPVDNRQAIESAVEAKKILDRVDSQAYARNSGGCA